MKKYRISIIFLIVAVLLFSISAIAGSYVDSAGLLIEPAFPCIPFGYMSLGLAIITAIHCFSKQHINNK